MSEKKLSDNEIIKDLECYRGQKLFAFNGKKPEIYIHDVLDLINRQKAEIEMLKKDSKRLKKVQMQLDDLCKMHHIIKAEAYKEFLVARAAARNYCDCTLYSACSSSSIFDFFR